MTDNAMNAELRSVAERLGGGGTEDDEREDDLSFLRDAHWPIENAAWAESEATELLASWLDGPALCLRRGAAIALGHIAPGVLLGALTSRLRGAETEALGAWTEGIEVAVWSLNDYYFGDYGCPGYLDSLPEAAPERLAEYERLQQLCGPVFVALGRSKCVQDLRTLVENVRPAQTA